MQRELRPFTLRAAAYAAGPAPAPEDPADRRGRRAGFAEDQPVRDAGSDRIADRQLGEITSGIGVSRSRRVVRAPVELDDHAVLLVADVLIGTATGREARGLTTCARQSVWSLHSIAVATLEHRAESFVQVTKHGDDQRPAGDTRTSGECCSD